MLQHDLNGLVPGHTLNQLQRHPGSEGERDPRHPEAMEIPYRRPARALALGTALLYGILLLQPNLAPDERQFDRILDLVQVMGDGRLLLPGLRRHLVDVQPGHVEIERLPHPRRLRHRAQAVEIRIRLLPDFLLRALTEDVAGGNGFHLERLRDDLLHAPGDPVRRLLVHGGLLREHIPLRLRLGPTALLTLRQGRLRLGVRLRQQIPQHGEHGDVDRLAGLRGLDRHKAILQVHRLPIQQTAVPATHGGTHARYDDRPDERVLLTGLEDELHLLDAVRITPDLFRRLRHQPRERVAPVRELGMQMLERGPQELQLIVPRLGGKTPFGFRVHERLRRGRRHRHELPGHRLMFLHVLHEPLQHAEAPGHVAFTRLPPAGDSQPQLLQVRHLRELDLLPRLDLSQPLDHALLEGIAADLRHPLIELDLRLPARRLELLIPGFRRPFRAFALDRHIQSNLPNLLPIPEPPIPPMRPRLQLKRHRTPPVIVLDSMQSSQGTNYQMFTLCSRFFYPKSHTSKEYAKNATGS